MPAADAHSPFPIGPSEMSAAAEPLMPVLGRVEDSPSALKIILGGKLRALRVAAGLKPADVKERLRYSEPKITRIELGDQGLKEADARALLDLYGVTYPLHVAEFMRVLELSKRPEFWQPWHDSVQGFFAPLLSLEGAASLVRVFEPDYVPGLLQTEEYARAVVRAEWPTYTDHAVERIVSLRRERQRQFGDQRDDEDATHLWVAIREDVLLHSVADPGVRLRQAEHLLSCARHPRVTVQVVPAEARSKVPITSNVTYLRFNLDELPDAVYIEQTASSVFLRDPGQVEHYFELLNRLATVIRTPEESVQWLQDRVHEWR
ncbi:transcriptional regulator [Streptomyces spiroverticillatus]|uniref:Transcriptional regulator n=1 Tax=Streptomyces finlayi TaxID=67296 RepID=A0A919CDQ7_9ACTN|nr:helix-turn-helix transcriptional regulator [Streptomyces finlayi]GHA43553.1 transcriptional regulator [Streptomyces spiroverticillatus]GHD13311.1 transcriptional regulator [Streptomyces finlayi]